MLNSSSSQKRHKTSDWGSHLVAYYNKKGWETQTLVNSLSGFLRGMKYFKMRCASPRGSGCIHVGAYCHPNHLHSRFGCLLSAKPTVQLWVSGIRPPATFALVTCLGLLLEVLATARMLPFTTFFSDCPQLLICNCAHCRTHYGIWIRSLSTRRLTQFGAKSFSRVPLTCSLEKQQCSNKI